MYGHKARESVIAVLKEDPILSMAAIKENPKPDDLLKDAKKLRPVELRRIADRLLIELWMRGFAVEARRVGARPLKDAPDHKAWRDGKLAREAARRERRKQTDVEEKATA